jgi:hypothetical protein
MGEPYVVTGNRMRYKDGPAELVDYLFDFDDGKERGAWRKLAYRRLYEGTVRLVEEALDGEWAKEWARAFKSLVMLTNWLLPYACKATLFDRTKPQDGFSSQQMWYSSWQSQRAEEFMALYDTRADSEQGEDFETLLALRRRYNSWTAGREKILFGQPLRSKMVLEIRGLSRQAREEYVAGLMT